MVVAVEFGSLSSYEAEHGDSIGMLCVLSVVLTRRFAALAVFSTNSV